jgi:hypothetical protein
MEPSIDSLLLADFAEVVNGKLYVMGAGFTTVALPAFDQPYRFFVAAGLRIPWSHTNQEIPFTVRLETLDGDPIDCWSLDGQMEAGRAPGQRGEDSVSMFAAPVDVVVPEPIDVVVRFAFGTDQRTARFRFVVAVE